MTFEEYWTEVGKLNALPQMAIIQLPASLSDFTKKRLMKKKAEETAGIMQDAIDEVNKGSIESVDSMVKKRL
jgi:hypothetical protein